MTRARLNGVLLTILVLSLQALVDAFILLNHQGQRRTGVFIFLLIGDICIVLVLRYVISWTCSELKSNKRACSIILWFVTIFVTQIKTYFIVDAMKKDCVYRERILMNG